MMIGKMLLLILGILAGLVLLCACVIWFEKRAPGETYDERQKIARGNAYRLSTWVGLIYTIAAFAYLEFQSESAAVEATTLLFVGLELQLMAFHIYCLLTNSAMPLGEKGWITVGGYLCCGSMNFQSFRQTRGSYARIYGSDVIPEECWMFFSLAVTFVTLAAMHLIRLLWKEKEE